MLSANFFFGCIRQRGSVNNNPTIMEALKSTQTLRVIKSICINDITGNVRGRKRKSLEFEDLLDLQPLHKRRRLKYDMGNYDIHRYGQLN